jgi:DNA-binding MarR family transcriptional regulator
MISAKALGVLTEAASGLVPITAEDMAKHFKCGRSSMLAALKELRDIGYIETTTAHIDGRFVTYSKVTESGYKSLETRLLSTLAMQNSNNSVLANSLVCKPGTPTESVEEFNKLEIEVESMGYDFFEKTSSMDKDEMVAERRKADAKKKADYEQDKENKRKARLTRHHTAQEDWTPTDVGYEFADRIFKVWHIKPWSVTNSQFIPALATQRKKHDTNGAVEIRIMDMFFESIDFEKYDDAEKLWKLFIYKFPSYVLQAKTSMIPAQESEEEIRLKEKAMSRLRGNV